MLSNSDLTDTSYFFPALKYPSPASSIIFQSPGMANGTIEENKVIEEVSEWENLETGKEGEEEEEEEDFTESEDDQDDVEEEEKEVNQGFIRLLPVLILTPST